MSIDRMKDYTGRHWALKLDETGVLASVHHFSSGEVRDNWVAMDPGLRIAVDADHPEVFKWLTQDPSYTSLSLWSRFWNRIAKIGRR